MKLNLEIGTMVKVVDKRGTAVGSGEITRKSVRTDGTATYHVNGGEFSFSDRIVTHCRPLVMGFREIELATGADSAL